uniref:Uncharacterized protein n=1 Tax=Oryza nivara TaxID=4536 RepID=A0A0E0HYY3_ORYNI
MTSPTHHPLPPAVWSPLSHSVGPLLPLPEDAPPLDLALEARQDTGERRRRHSSWAWAHRGEGSRSPAGSCGGKVDAQRVGFDARMIGFKGFRWYELKNAIFHQQILKVNCDDLFL